MSLITLKGMICTGHECWPPRPSTEGSNLFDVEGVEVHLQGHAWAAHTCPDIPETHASVLAAGSRLFDVEGRQVGRIGDPVACGSSVAQGHPLFDIAE
jgi:uncharacterized Zn-binding protein involved in type VI secretion